MAIKRQKRGVSVGTISMLSISAATILTALVIFSRISGGISQISIDPKMLTEPITMLARSITNTEPSNTTDPSASGVTPQETAPVQNEIPAIAIAPTATPAPTLPPTQVLTLAAVGQLTLGSDLQKAARDETGAFGFDPMLAPVASALSDAALSIVTLRTGLTRDSGSFDTYCAPSEIVGALQGAGINLFNLGTDRLFDNGMKGVTATRGILSSLHAEQVGAYQTLEERQAPQIIEVSGVKVGVLSYVEGISAAGKKAASESEIANATRLLDLAAATADITTLRARGANLIVVMAHWGGRSDTKPSRDTRAAADALVAAGADIILGTNPTTVHEMERRAVTDAYGGTREVFIAYSLGNFLIDDTRDTGDITGVVLRLQIEWNTQSNRASIQDAWYMPTWIMRWKDKEGVNRYRVVPAGSAAIPDGMTDTIYINMKKAYQAIIKKLGDQAARPRME